MSSPERDRVQIDRESREDMGAEPSWFERHFGHARAHEADQPTARCNDGEYSYSLQHRGACSQHGGVNKWLD